MTTALAVILPIAQTAFAVMGNLQAGKAEQQAANYRAAVARNNQQIATQNARYSRERASILAFDRDKETAGLLGEQKRIQAGSGISLGSGSFMRTRRTARRLGVRDRENIIHAGEVDATNFENQAAGFGAESVLEKATAKDAKLATYLNVGSSLVGGATSLMRSRARYGKGLMR